MGTVLERQSFAKRLKTMLKTDFKRMFTMPLVYILIGVSFVLPILILVMTTMVGNAPAEGEETVGMFTSVWQAVGSANGAMTMDLTGMCNINMLYFIVAVLVCVFVSDDFRSGYAKNLFAVRSKKLDYVMSKTLVTFVGAAAMFAAYFIGAMIGGAIAGLSFDTAEFGAGGVVSCMFSKVFMTAVFAAISLLLSVVGKQRLWLSLIGSFAASMLLFTMVPIIAPLNSGILNIIMCLGGGIIFAAGFGTVSNVVLNKTDLI